jgi:hypothetical protein|nr:hypothetical protein [uncultured Stomatobaculum sp.]
MKKERERPTGTGNKSVSVANHARRLGLFTCNRYGRSSHSACRVSVRSGEPFNALHKASQGFGEKFLCDYKIIINESSE